MKESLITLLSLLILFCIGFLFVNLFAFQKTAVIDNHTFIVEIAKTAAQKETGLAKYKKIPENFSMYFPFDRADYYAFWMKNMQFSIDILFLRNHKIVTIYQNVPFPKTNQIQLPTYQPLAPADAVLEINAGLSKKYGFKVDDFVYLHV